MKTNTSILSVFFSLLLLWVCCKPDTVEPEDDSYNLVVPRGFPAPRIPPDNALTNRRVSLGKRLFFDPILSRDSTIACGSCHTPALAFCDTNRFSKGVMNRLGDRNAPALVNMAYNTSFFWDGGVPTLEQQAIAPIENHLEMDFTLPEAVERLAKHKDYPALFQAAYGRQPDIFSLVRAISAYERTLISGTSRYDKYVYVDKASMNEQEIRGMNVFMGEKGECFHCHGEFNFTDNSFKNNGLYLTYADSGRARITFAKDDVGKFKVPTLRNIGLTAPYMHDGSLKTLEQVVEHYSSGGKGHPNQSIFIKPLNMTTQEKADLVAFLKALTDDEFIAKNR